MKLRTPVSSNMIDNKEEVQDHTIKETTKEDQDNTTTDQTCITEDNNKCITEVCKEVTKVCHHNRECNNNHLNQCQELSHQCHLKVCHRCQLNNKLTHLR